MATRPPGPQPCISLLHRPAGSAEWSLPPIPTLHNDLRTCHSSVHPPLPHPMSALCRGAPLPGFFLPCPRGRMWGEGAWGREGLASRGSLGCTWGDPGGMGLGVTWTGGPTHLGHAPHPTTLGGRAMAKPSEFTHTHPPTPTPCCRVPGPRRHTLCLCGSLLSFPLVHPGGRVLRRAVGLLCASWPVTGGSDRKAAHPSSASGGREGVVTEGRNLVAEDCACHAGSGSPCRLVWRDL